MTDPTADAGESSFDSSNVARARDLLDSVPQTIGRYKILERIGGGGMGDVFVAEQTVPIKRRVALKIIKAGMDTRQVVARFEAERQALAMMDHPNIAKVYDASTTDTGRPYFAMELVRGVPITQFCDESKLTTRQRVELLVPVCQAVQHAHQKGIIHRDLKPTNVLVTLHDGTPVPKVIDFGIAKATTQPLTDKTVYTEFRQMIGTPAYMSPEQAEMSGLDIDTRSDIYSLGVLMYELLTGTTPFDTTRLVKAGVGEIQRIIREEDPPKPSLRISSLGQTLPSVAAQRSIEPARLGKLVRGELDWIVMKALEKDRRRRYETANDFALDIQRYLKGDAIVAAPPSLAYRTRKFVRRNRVAVSVATVVCAILVGSSLAISGLALRLRQQVGTTTAALAEAKDQGKRAADASSRADAEARNALAALKTAQSALAEQNWTNARLLIRTDQFAKARGVIRQLGDSSISDTDRRWLAWDCARRSHEYSRLDLMQFMPPGTRKVSAVTSGGRVEVRPQQGDLLYRFAGQSEYQRLPLPKRPPYSTPDPLIVEPLSDRVRIIDVTTLDPTMTSPTTRASAQRATRRSVNRQTRLRVTAMVDGETTVLTRDYSGGISHIDRDDSAGRIALGMDNGRVIVLSLTGAELVETFSTDSECEGFFQIKLEPGRDVLWLAQYDWLVRCLLLDRQPDVAKTYAPSTHTATARYVGFSADGTIAATTGYDEHLKVWRTGDLSLIKDLDLKSLGSENSNPRASNVQFVGESRSKIIFVVYAKSAWEWDFSEEAGAAPVRLPIDGRVGRILLSRDGQTVFAATENGEGGAHVLRYDRRTGHVSKLATYTDGRFAYAFALSPDEHELVWCTSATGDFGGSDNPDEVASCDLTTGERRPRISGFTSGLRDVDLSPDGRLLVVASRDGTARLYEWPDAKLRFTLDVKPGLSHTNIVSSARFHPTEPWMVTAIQNQNNSITIWDYVNGRELATIDAEPTGTRGYHIGFLKCAVFAPDGKRLYACVGDDYSGELMSIDLHFWDATVGELLRK